MKRLKFLSTLALASTALVSEASTIFAAKKEPISYTITETEDLLILSGTAKDATFDCKSKILYLKGYYDITYCSFKNVTHYAYEVHPDSRFDNNEINFIGSESTESVL